MNNSTSLLFSVRVTKILAITSLVLSLLTSFFLSTASAQEYYYTLSPSTTETKQLSHRAGQTTFISTTYNASTQRFVWQMSFTPSPTTNWLPNGLYMVINNGFFPKGRQGETAMLFFDATNPAAPALTAYAYNGNNAGDSWKIGDFGGSQPPDKIISSLADSSWINSLSVSESSGMKVFSIDINVTKINAHSPAYPSLGWFGLRFDSHIGIWAHPVANMSTSYGPDGFLTKRTGNEGYVDAAREITSGCDGIVGSNSQIDICGICGGNGSSCVKPPTENENSVCNSSNVTSNIFALDSRAAELKNISQILAKKIKHSARRNKSVLMKADAQLKQAQNLYIKAWSTIWSVPTNITSCIGSVSCLSIDLLSLTSGYSSSVTQQYKVIEAQIKLLRKISSASAIYRKNLKLKAINIVNLIRSDISSLHAVPALSALGAPTAVCK